MAGGAGPGLISTKVSSGQGLARRETAEVGDGLEGTEHNRERGSDPEGCAMNLQTQHQRHLEEGKRAVNMHQDGRKPADLPHQPSCEGGHEPGVTLGSRPGGGKETARKIDDLLPGESVGDGARVLPTTQQGRRLSSDPSISAERADQQRSRGNGGGVGKGRAETSNEINRGSLSMEEVPPMARGIKLAVVAGEAGVQLFDVGLHDAGEVAETASIS